MLYIILLLILAVLLLGSSVVSGALGLIGGAIVAAIALSWFAISFEFEPMTALLIIVAGLIGLVGLLLLGAWLHDVFIGDPKRKRELEAILRGDPPPPV